MRSYVISKQYNKYSHKPVINKKVFSKIEKEREDAEKKQIELEKTYKDKLEEQERLIKEKLAQLDKLAKIDTEFEEGNFDNLDYFLTKRQSKEALLYALEWCSYHGNLPLVKKMVSVGADVSGSKYVAAQMAGSMGHLDVLQFLIECQIPDNESIMEIFEEAVEKNYYDIVDYFLSNFSNNIKHVSEIIKKSNDAEIKQLYEKKITSKL